MVRCCSNCKIIKPISEFHKDRSQSGGFTYSCKTCKCASKRNGYALLKKNNPNKLRVMWKNSQLKSDYGITLTEQDLMRKDQNDVCKICKSPTSQIRNRDFMTDHDHVTGKVRGLLCGPCNSIIGLCKENVDTLKEVIKYLEYNSCTSPRQVPT